MLDAGLVAVIVDGAAVADGLGGINKDGLRGHRCAEGACEFAGCVFHDGERVGCFCGIVFHLVYGIVFVGVDSDEGGVFGCELGV